MSIVDRHPSWLTHRSGLIQRADRLKIQNPREECTSVFLRILWKRQRVVAPRSPLKKKDSFSCRHCFPVFSRAAPEWLYHFRSSGRHFDSYAHIMDRPLRLFTGGTSTRSERLRVRSPTLSHYIFTPSSTHRNRRLAELLSGYETGHCGRPRSTGRGLRVHFKRETRALHLFSLAVFLHKIMLQKARRGKEINRGVVDQPFSHLYFSAKMKKAKGCMG